MRPPKAVGHREAPEPVEPMSDIVISIKPRFAEAILSGRKTVELRKTSARLRPGTRALIYASSPTRALVGSAVITRRHQLSIDGLWTRFGGQAAIDEGAFRRYYAGDVEGVAFELSDVRRHAQAVSLEELRRLGDGFRPPQSYMRSPAFLRRLAERRAWWVCEPEQAALAL